MKMMVAMSGGVDSAVAALKLVKQGHDVAGAFMKNWSLSTLGVQYHPWEDEAAEARAVCQVLGIPFFIFDFEAEYKSRVMNHFVREYQAGRTPNPDVLCNREIKFDLFWQAAQQKGAERIATGHYAQIKSRQDQFQLCQACDQSKDQSYFLYTLTQKELAVAQFPVGHLLKTEVRKEAAEAKLPNAQKKDSQGVCFIGPVTMRTFLQQYIPLKSGPVITPKGEVIGQHDGVWFYTEGQRHGFSTGGHHAPLYVAEKRVVTNELVVVPEGDERLLTTRIEVSELSWTNLSPHLPLEVMSRVRYRQPLQPSKLTKDGLKFLTPVKAVAVGQSVVFYQDEAVLGGGVIERRF